VDRGERARWQHRPLDALLASVLEEGADVAEIAEDVLVLGALRADRQRLADLGDHDADAAGRHLDPRVLVDPVDRPQQEAPAGHQQLGLVAGLAVERDHAAVAELRAEALDGQPDLGRPDVLDRLRDDEANCEDDHDEENRYAEDHHPDGITGRVSADVHFAYRARRPPSRRSSPSPISAKPITSFVRVGPSPKS
jgi:hypothetical protein